VERLGIVTTGLEQPIVRLSGGNQQKVVLGKWLLGKADVLIFDEPTHGVDVGAKEDVYAEVAALAAEGKAVIFISSELEELERVASRVIVLREGELVGELKGPDVTEAQILKLCYGHGDAA
jgi:ABC-type sugar transport system ATPase subunit